MSRFDTAGTAGDHYLTPDLVGRHTFRAELCAEYGYRLHCADCGEDDSHRNHRRAER